MRTLGILFFLLHLITPEAQAQLDMVVNALGHANGVALSNPPMPSLYGKKGTYKLGVQAGILDGVKPAEGDIKTLDYSGYNFSTIYNQMFGNSWGVYLLGSVSEVGGEITAPGQNSSGTLDSTNLKSQLYMLSTGITYRLISNKWLSLPVMIGPAYISGQFSGRFVQRDASNMVLDDFDAEASPSFLGWMAGVQAAFSVHRHLSIIPYFLTMQPMSGEARCQEFSTTNVRVSGTLFDQSSPACEASGGNNKSQLEFDVFVQSLGLNLAIPSLGLTFNLYTETGDVPLFEGTSIDFYSVSFSMGMP